MRDVMLGKIAIPEYEARVAHYESERAELETLKTEEDEINFQTKYVNLLCEYSCPFAINREYKI